MPFIAETKNTCEDLCLTLTSDLIFRMISTDLDSIVFSVLPIFSFDVDDVEFFTPSIRSSIVDFIIRRKRYSDDASDDFGFGIERLLNDKSYCAAYPLHDASLSVQILPPFVDSLHIT